MGSNDDVNVLNQSHLFSKIIRGEAPPCTFTVNGCMFNKVYYLADGIYSEWSTLVKSFKRPIDPKTSKFKKYQESIREDIEWAFAILQGRFQIFQQPAKSYYICKIKRFVLTCVILHNMITEDNGRAFCGLEDDYLPVRRARGTIQERVGKEVRMDAKIRDMNIHRLLRDMLVEHIWRLPPNYRIRHNPTSIPSNNQDEARPSEHEVSIVKFWLPFWLPFWKLKLTDSDMRGGSLGMGSTYSSSLN
ncbi:uncharacterized protein [Rutidosis leptorrhynchoides]|uniref:uncharacterized protein n=1 Tax=Rutidosis leptorrhynchoides TaxID=125765 RepID=UPI003A9941C5